MSTSTQQLTPVQVKLTAQKHGYEPAAVRAVAQVEGGGQGYSGVTGRILIQFEPFWFKQFLSKASRIAIDQVLELVRLRKLLAAAQQVLFNNWMLATKNRVEDQTVEYQAFSAAFAIQPDAAMKGTSWGLGQVMGHHYKALGFATVDAFVDYCKVSEANQLDVQLRFIDASAQLRKALREKNWDVFAYFYNGKNYKGDPTTYKDDYDYKLRQAYLRFSADPVWR
jgi:hypothetical protein